MPQTEIVSCLTSIDSAWQNKDPVFETQKYVATEEPLIYFHLPLAALLPILLDVHATSFRGRLVITSIKSRWAMSFVRVHGL